LKRRKNIEVRKLNKKMLEIFQNMLMLLLGKQFENVENSLSIHLKTEKNSILKSKNLRKLEKT
jgi:hypothetical protein